MIQSRVVMGCYRENNLRWDLKARLDFDMNQRRKAVIPGGRNASTEQRYELHYQRVIIKPPWLKPSDLSPCLLYTSDAADDANVV